MIRALAPIEPIKRSAYPFCHGELLKLGIEVAQSTVSIYMVPRRGRPLQTWKTFLRNHMEGIASIDLFVLLLHRSCEIAGRRSPDDWNVRLPPGS